MSSLSIFEDIIQTVLENLRLLENDVNACLQDNIPPDLNDYIKHNFEICYYRMSCEMNKLKIKASNALKENNGENKELQQLQKAEHIIQLQTLSAMISRHVCDLTQNSKSTDS